MADNLRKRVPDTVPDDIELFEQDGDVYGRDENDNEFSLDPLTGSAKPQEDRCGAVVTSSMERYGQTRYCTAMPEETFVDDGSQFCRLHKSKEALMEQAQELFKHGHFATNYVNFARHLPSTKFLFAVEMVDGLFQMSEFDFDIIRESRTIDTSESDMIHEDAVEVELPIPQNSMRSLQADQLWHAALAEIEMNNMREVVFMEATDGRHGEKEKVAQTADMEGKITDTMTERVEHHLHLPISRLATDIKKYLKNGGVDLDDDDGGVVTFQQNDYTMDFSPQETDTGDAEDASEVAADFSEQLAAEDSAGDSAVEVEVEE